MAYLVSRTEHWWDVVWRFVVSKWRTRSEKTAWMYVLISYVNSWVVGLVDQFMMGVDALLLRYHTRYVVSVLGVIYIWQMLCLLFPFLPVFGVAALYVLVLYSFAIVASMSSVPSSALRGQEREDYRSWSVFSWSVFLGSWAVGFLMGSFYAAVFVDLLSPFVHFFPPNMLHMSALLIVASATIQEICKAHDLLFPGHVEHKDEHVQYNSWVYMPAALFSALAESLTLAYFVSLSAPLACAFFMLASGHYMLMWHQLLWARDVQPLPTITLVFGFFHRAIHAVSDFFWLASFAPLSSGWSLRCVVAATSFCYRYAFDKRLVDLSVDLHYQLRCARSEGILSRLLPLERFLSGRVLSPMADPSLEVRPR